ncbi:uncharacterized protein LOC123264014 [Cotesia glomerata]|uniref:uncharacterized protein LOC123264014 n=1 Tax=Cotesia glomerata TaxID=32391 RepID=UPI001D026C7D|nr:uncharacterized protein LOC123264014 [Cotesia glomerata]
MENPNLNVNNNKPKSSQQTQQSQRPSSSRNVNYANITTKDSFPKREQAIIVESLDNNFSEPHLYLSRDHSISRGTSGKKSILTINNQQLPIRSLIVKNKRIVLSNVCPTIPHYIIEQELKNIGIEPQSTITYLRTGTANPKYTHILSFRRQVYVSPTDEKKLPDKLQINYEDINYWIYPTCDSFKCFLCKEDGHLARNCPTNNQNSQLNPENEETAPTVTPNSATLQLQADSEVQIASQTQNNIQVLASSPDTIIQPTQIISENQEHFNLPKLNEPELPKRPHPPTCSTISSLDIKEKDQDIETDSEFDTESTTSEASNSNTKLNYNQESAKNIVKKRKLTKKEDSYDAAWNNVKENVNNQDPPGNYVLTIDQLRHLIENTKGKTDIRDTVKLYSEDVESIIIVANRASGGVAIFVKSHSIPEEVQLITDLEAVAVRIKYPANITLCNIYIPNSKALEIEELSRIAKQLPKPFILLGDFNCHHEFWGSDFQDPRGIQIANWLDSNENLILSNTGQPTHFCARSGRTSCIDLTIVDKSIASDVRWFVLEHTHDSDHFPIIIKLLTPDDYTSSDHTEKFLFEKADWDLYQSKIDELLQRLPELDPRVETPVDDITAEFSSIILEAAKLAIPKTNNTGKKKQVYWWNDECKKAILDQKKAFRLYKKYAYTDQSDELKIEFKKKRAIVRRTLKNSRRNSWREFVSSINNQTPATEVWNKIHCLNTGKKKAFSTIVLEKDNGKFTAHPKETANMLADSFALNSSSSNYEDKFLDFKKREETNSLFDTQDNSLLFNKELSMHELTRELAKLRNSSPGPDGIPNILIKNLSTSGLCYLLDLFNLIWLRQLFPKNWKEAIIVPILKPNKIPSDCKSYRPIALTCNICKLMEKIVSKRLRWYLEANNLISPWQYGFRQFRSTQDHLTNFVTQICDSFIDNQSLITTSLDIEKAYEMAWAFRLLRILEKKNIRGNLLAFIKNFLTNRRIQVRVDHTLSDSKIVENGLPQGAVLSVILFLIDINDVLDLIPAPVKGNLFADDLIVYCSGKNLRHTGELVQKTLDSLQGWSDECGFKFSKTKSEFIIFGRGRKKRSITLQLGDHKINQVDHIKLLGLYFDEKLSWKVHLKKLISVCRNRINLLKVMSSTKWGADKHSMLLAYRAIIRSKMDYGAGLYDTAAGHRLKELDSIHNLALRLSIGAHRTSPINSILAESEEMPLHLRRKEILLKFMIRAQAQEGDPAFGYTEKKPVTDLEYRLKNISLKPPRVRFKIEIDKLDTTVPKMAPRRQSVSPPWNIPTTYTDLELAEMQRNTTTEQTYRNLFQAILEKYQNYTAFYTDGSVKEERTSCAVVYLDTKLGFRLQNFNSIFTCEATAISKALSIAIDNPELGHIAIFTDSMSCLSALSNTENTNPIILNIQKQINVLTINNRRVKLIWTPAHQGILGNEEADRVAKEAINNDIISNSMATTAKETTKHLKSLMKCHWKKIWEQWTRNNSPKLAEVRKDLLDTQPVDSFCRRDQVVLSRLRIGHTKVTHSYLISKEPKKACDFCNMELSVKHILTECQGLDIFRNKTQLPNNIKDCLNSTSGCYRTLIFLKEAKLIEEI